MKTSWSREEQIDLFKKLGLEPASYDPKDLDSVAKFQQAALKAQINMKTPDGSLLTDDEYLLCAKITGRNA